MLLRLLSQERGKTDFMAYGKDYPKSGKTFSASDEALEQEEESVGSDSTNVIKEKPLRPKDLPSLVRTGGSGEADFISIGFGSSVAINRVLAVVAPDSAPIRRLLHDARDKGLLIDATFGRKTKAILILDSGHVLTAALQPETIISRVRSRRQP